MKYTNAIGFNRYGAAEVLEPLRVARPTPAHNQVLVRVAAVSVNPADWRIRNGQFRLFMRSPFPFIPGTDIAGVVEEVGAAVTRFRIGDAVYGLLPTTSGGGYAEYAAVSEEAAAPMPVNLSFAEAAAVPLTALTALQALRDKAKLQPDAQVLINGASGGVGTFAVQIAKAMGAHVTAVCSGRNTEFVHGLGADVIRDYTSGDVTADTVQYDIVLDAVNTLPFWKGRRLVQRGGVFVSVNPILANPLSKLLIRATDRRIESILVQPRGGDLDVLTQWIEAGQVRPVIDQQYPLSGAVEAHRYSETAHVRGKLVLVIDEQLATP